MLNLNEELFQIVCREDVEINGEKIRYKTTDGKVKLPRRAGEILSTLNESQQEVIFQFLESDDAFIPVSRAAPIKALFRGNPGLDLEKLRSVINDWTEVSEAVSKPENGADTETESESENTEISLNELQSYFKDEIPQKIRDKVQALFTKWYEAGSPENFEIKSTAQQVVEGSPEA